MTRRCSVDREMFRPLVGREFRYEKELQDAMRDIFLYKDNRMRISPDWTIRDAYEFACREGLVRSRHDPDGKKVITFVLHGLVARECTCPRCGDRHQTRSRRGA